MSVITELAQQGRWKITGIADLGAPTGRCEVCNRPIRYEYSVRQQQAAQEMTCGSTCGPTLVKASLSEAYWKDVIAAYERQLGRVASPEEVEKLKDQTSAAEWKRMAEEFVQEQGKQAKEQLPKLLERYVALNPGFNITKSLLEQLKAGRALSIRQIEVATDILSKADWDDMEKRAAARPPPPPPEKVAEIGPRLDAVLAWEALDSRDRALISSFKQQFDRRGSLSGKQLAILDRVAAKVLGTDKPLTPEGKRFVQDFAGAQQPARTPPPAAPAVRATQEPDANEMIGRLMAQGRLSEKQKELLTSFARQLGARGVLSEKQTGIVKDIFGRLKPPPAAGAEPARPAAAPTQAPAARPAARSRYADDAIDPDDL